MQYGIAGQRKKEDAMLIGMIILLAGLGALPVWGMSDVLDGNWNGQQPEDW